MFWYLDRYKHSLILKRVVNKTLCSFDYASMKSKIHRRYQPPYNSVHYHQISFVSLKKPKVHLLK